MTQKERLVEMYINYYLQRDENKSFWSEDNRVDEYLKPMGSKLADYLLDNGVIAPPCKVGDVLYARIIDHHNAGYIKPYFVEEILVENDDKVYVAVCDVNNTECSFCEDQIGKTVFLTEDEARQALKERDQK